MVKTLYVLCPLAGDAERDLQNCEYIALGPNSKKRIADAVRWQEKALPTAEVVWAFGAGTDKLHENGPTLAVLGTSELMRHQKDAVVVENWSDCEPYGTIEEINWIVDAVQQKYPSRELCFVFFSQSRHLLVVRWITRLFRYPVSMQFEETGYAKEISWIHVMRSFCKLLLVRLGLQKLVQWLRRRVNLRVDRV